MKSYQRLQDRFDTRGHQVTEVWANLASKERKLFPDTRQAWPRLFGLFILPERLEVGWAQQLNELKNKVENPQQTLVDYEQRNSILNLGNNRCRTRAE